ncbi:MAG: type II/IV secretion system protein, partial [Armatimonadetes bacterium]|nr:type II/IV secretion system protein [Armatimonadota bacterium]
MAESEKQVPRSVKAHMGLKYTEQARREFIRTLLLGVYGFSSDQWAELIRKAEISKCSVEKLLVQESVLTSEELHDMLERFHKVPTVELDGSPPEEEAIRLVPREIASYFKLIPYRLKDHQLFLAMNDPLDVETIDRIEILTKRKVRVAYAPLEDIEKAFQAAYETKARPAIEGFMTDALLEEAVEMVTTEGTLEDGLPEKLDITSLKALSEEAPIVKLANLIITKAFQSRASDIHVEPTQKELLVRLRVDGILRLVLTLSKQVHSPLISRFKVMAGMDISERRLSQDGRCEVNVKGHLYDLRMNTFPLIHGEKLVIRVLDPRFSYDNLASLGLSDVNLSRVGEMLRRPHGMILVTGPTGSGKSTTSAALLSELKSVEKNIISIEDPVEYFLDLVNQSQMHSKIGFTFASALRAILRQDPDIIMVGEIRDAETAEIAIHAALTGHLVLSTLHTNDSPGALIRLMDMGIASYLASETLVGIIAQRLLRKICEKCKEPYPFDPKALAGRFFKEDRVPEKLYRGRGCEACQYVGYSGRIGVYEVLLVTDRIASMLRENVDAEALKKKCAAEGLKTLREDALDKVIQG